MGLYADTARSSDNDSFFRAGTDLEIEVIGAKPRKQVGWTCRFPLDGSPRPPRSCDGESL